MGVGFILNHPDPAVLSCCFLGPFLKEEANDVGIFRILFLWIAIDDGVLTFFAVTDVSSSKLSLFDLSSIDMDGVYIAESFCDARFRSSD